MIIDYFEIIDNKSENLVKLIDEFPVSRTHWFPIFGFANIVPDLFKAETLKTQQRTKLANNFKTNMSRFDSLGLKNINEVLIAENIPESYKIEYIFIKYIIILLI